jgi:hypothetical protein
VEQRRTRRFTLTLPVAITRSGAGRVSQSGRTMNISSGGVLFTSDDAIDTSGPIEYIITLADGKEATVNLRCVGKILRYEKLDGHNGHEAYSVAATLERYEFVRSEG